MIRIYADIQVRTSEDSEYYLPIFQSGNGLSVSELRLRLLDVWARLLSI